VYANEQTLSCEDLQRTTLKLSFAVRGDRNRDMFIMRSVIIAGGILSINAMKAQVNDLAVDDDRGASLSKPFDLFFVI
jgi:hypothetical protein